MFSCNSQKESIKGWRDIVDNRIESYNKNAVIDSILSVNKEREDFVLERFNEIKNIKKVNIIFSEINVDETIYFIDETPVLKTSNYETNKYSAEKEPIVKGDYFKILTEEKTYYKSSREVFQFLKYSEAKTEEQYDSIKRNFENKAYSEIRLDEKLIKQEWMILELSLKDVLTTKNEVNN